jgi:hypothetical protein
MKFSPKDFDGVGSVGQDLFVVVDPDAGDAFGKIVISVDDDSIMPFMTASGETLSNVASRMVRRLAEKLDFEEPSVPFEVGDCVVLAGRCVAAEDWVARFAIVTAIDLSATDGMEVRCSYVDAIAGYDWRSKDEVLEVIQEAHRLKPL